MKCCPFCGSGLPDDMVFCTKCGKKHLNTPENPEVTTSIESPAQIQVSGEFKNTMSAVPPTENEKPPRKQKVKAAIWLVIALLLITVGTIGFLIAKENKKSMSIADAALSVLYLEICDDENTVIATASGFIIGDGTTLITNYHVIDGAHHIIAHTPDGESSVEIHTVLAYDEKADLAVLECENCIEVQPLLMGDSDALRQGDKVYAVGYPLGLANTLSDGVVSSRYLNDNNIDILQITAAISDGSSGGALFNESGQVVGVICASYVNGQNLNIAIPSNTVQRIMQQSSPTPLYTFFAPVYSVDYVIQNYKNLEGSLFYVDAWISSGFWREDSSICMYCVSSKSEVLTSTSNTVGEIMAAEDARQGVITAISSTPVPNLKDSLLAGRHVLLLSQVDRAGILLKKSYISVKEIQIVS